MIYLEIYLIGFIVCMIYLIGREISYWLHWDDNGYGAYHYTSFLEFMYTCKQWALKQNYSILTVPILEESGDLESVYWHVEVKVYSNEDEFIYFSSNEKSTEYEAVFMACEYILETKTKENTTVEDHNYGRSNTVRMDDRRSLYENKFKRQFHDEFLSLIIKDNISLEESRKNVLEHYWTQNMKIAEETNGIACTVENIRRDIKNAIENDYKINMIFHSGCLQCVGPKTYGIEYCEDCGYFSVNSCQDKCIKDN